MSDFAVSLIRTWTPMVAGAILGFLTSAGVQLDAQAAAALTAFLTALFGGLYYLVVRLYEKRYPKAGALLGVAAKPQYQEPK